MQDFYNFTVLFCCKIKFLKNIIYFQIKQIKLIFVFFCVFSSQLSTKKLHSAFGTLQKINIKWWIRFLISRGGLCWNITTTDLSTHELVSLTLLIVYFYYHKFTSKTKQRRKSMTGEAQTQSSGRLAPGFFDLRQPKLLNCQSVLLWLALLLLLWLGQSIYYIPSPSLSVYSHSHSIQLSRYIWASSWRMIYLLNWSTATLAAAAMTANFISHAASTQQLSLFLVPFLQLRSNELHV